MIGEVKLNWVIRHLDTLKDSGKTKSELCKEIGISPQELNNSINQRKSVGDALFDKLAAYFGVSQLDLSENTTINQSGHNNIVGDGNSIGDDEARYRERITELEARIVRLEKEKDEYWELIKKLTSK